MIWGIVIAIVVFIAFKLGSTSGQVVGCVQSSGGMRVKYAKLLDIILGGHKDSQIFVETGLIFEQGSRIMVEQLYSIFNNLQATRSSFNTR